MFFRDQRSEATDDSLPLLPLREVVVFPHHPMSLIVGRPSSLAAVNAAGAREDNTIFHALIWPAMLMAEGSYELPWNVVANAFLNIQFPGKDEEKLSKSKLSKSKGKAIWIEDYLQRFEPDPLRYYLTAIAPENQRAAFVIDDFIARNNGELVNALGNFINEAEDAHGTLAAVVSALTDRVDLDD